MSKNIYVKATWKKAGKTISKKKSSNKYEYFNDLLYTKDTNVNSYRISDFAYVVHRWMTCFCLGIFFFNLLGIAYARILNGISTGGFTQI